MRHDVTDRELEFLKLAAEGHSRAAIGALLFVSEDTVKDHLKLIYLKLAARNRAHAVAIAFRQGLLN